MYTFAAPLFYFWVLGVFFASQKARVCACGCNECFLSCGYVLTECYLQNRALRFRFFWPLREARFVDTTRDGGESLSPENTCCKRLVQVHTVKHTRRFRPGPVFEA